MTTCSPRESFDSFSRSALIHRQTGRRLVDMKSVGAYEAKTTLSALLDEVEKGGRVAITRHGVTVAVLVPPGVERRDSSDVLEELRTFRQGRRLGEKVRGLIQEGRRR